MAAGRERSTPYASMSAKSWPSIPGAPFVGAALGIGMRQNVVAADLVVQGVEAIAGLCLSFRL